MYSCTIVQKDVLIDLVAYAQAFLGKRLPLPLNEDQVLLAKIRNKIYRTSYKDLDYKLLVEQIKGIIDKYKHLPQLP
ncbi:hypothetical protein [Psittacicella gerlachiana]|uniref:Uncharacterized protein n=1 Tax=Psittacicella gerlachiana TaxID=2028574 RepID=A0A3A1YK53_9GAMM|nr:hypothetical protein [Psittacicella gerlachiana]RIY37420.1 hypothetical protein CKF59_01810 [Psittacicella gerlachiana]